VRRLHRPIEIYGIEGLTQSFRQADSQPVEMPIHVEVSFQLVY